MKQIHRWWTRLRGLFRKKQLDRELDAEMASHLEMHIVDNLRSGMTPEAARRDALIKLGGLEQTKENYRDRRGIAWLEALFRDLSFALRMLRKSPGFCVVAVLALALGIGFSSIVFSIFYNGILNPFPYRDADRLMAISIMDDRNGTRQFRPVFHLDEIAAFRKENHTFEDMVGISSWDVLYTRQGITEQVHGCVMTPNATKFFGVPPMLGRGLMEPDSQQGADPVVLLGYEYWKKEFHQDKSVIGKTMMIPRFRLISFGTCAGIGLGLALIGLFGVRSYSVTLQTQKLGVRMALGAQPGNVLMQVLRKGLLLVGSGILVGLLTAFLSVRVLQSQLWCVSAFDVGAFVLAPLALLSAGLLACYLPARRATNVDPMIALRYE
jgi:MacB-like periplasmic core domain/FtsX-like permease family